MAGPMTLAIVELAPWARASMLTPGGPGLPVSHACITAPSGLRILAAHQLASTFHNGIDPPARAGEPVLQSPPAWPSVSDVAPREGTEFSCITPSSPAPAGIPIGSPALAGGGVRFTPARCSE